MNKVDVNKKSLATISLCVLTLFILIVIQGFWAYQIDSVKLANAKVFSSLSLNLFLNTQLLLQLSGFLVLFFILHLSLSWVIVLYAKALTSKFNPTSSKRLTTRFYLYSLMLHLSLLFLLNSWLFPNSKFAQALLFGETITLALFISYFVSLIFLLKAQVIKPLMLVGLVWLIPVLYGLEKSHTNESENKELPNIFIFSIDSLRPDYTNPNDPKLSHTPFLSQQLASSINFTQAYTPLARTFPAWMSILTGLYPHEHKAQYNLTSYKQILPVDTLAKTLQSQGYTSIYASDEKRFANIKKELGFDYLIGPSMGGNDFIIGQFADFPLSNLFSLLPLAERAMPFVVNNRAAAYAYNPEAASLNFAQKIIKYSNSKPIFAAVHFCLPHYPFSWRNSPFKELDESYAQSLAMADTQLKIIYNQLKEAGLINQDSLQIFLSDHGEALNKDKIFWHTQDGQRIKQMSYGHGTDVKQLSQHHVVMAAQSSKLKPQTIHNLSSLTLLKDGILNWQKNPHAFKTKQINWVRFESGYSPSALRYSSPKLGKLFFDASKFYGLNQQAHLIIKPEAYEHLLTHKDYAYFDGQTLYAQIKADWFKVETNTHKVKKESLAHIIKETAPLYCKNRSGCR